MGERDDDAVVVDLADYARARRERDAWRDALDLMAGFTEQVDVGVLIVPNGDTATVVFEACS